MNLTENNIVLVKSWKFPWLDEPPLPVARYLDTGVHVKR